MNSKQSLARWVGCLSAAALVAAGSFKAEASQVPGAGVFVQADGDVIAKFLYSNAGYNNLLYLSSPANSLGLLFQGHTTAPGTTVNLGFYLAGTELIFMLDNQDGGNWYTGPASRNSDNVIHAVVDDAYAPGETFVGFEDLNGGGDRDYDDIGFSFSNVGGTPPPASVPDAASTLPLLGLGLAGLAFMRRARK